MLKLSVFFFCFGLISILLGANNVGSVSVEAGKALLFAFIILSTLGFIGWLIFGGVNDRQERD